MFQFQVPDEPRFNEVVERIVANYNFQLTLLDELRASGISAEEMRRDYLQQ